MAYRRLSNEQIHEITGYLKKPKWRKKYSDELIEDIIHWYTNTGCSMRELGEKFGLSKGKMSYIITRYYFSKRHAKGQ